MNLLFDWLHIITLQGWSFALPVLSSWNHWVVWMGLRACKNHKLLLLTELISEIIQIPTENPLGVLLREPQKCVIPATLKSPDTNKTLTKVTWYKSINMWTILIGSLNYFIILLVYYLQTYNKIAHYNVQNNSPITISCTLYQY